MTRFCFIIAFKTLSFSSLSCRVAHAARKHLLLSSVFYDGGHYDNNHNDNDISIDNDDHDNFVVKHITIAPESVKIKTRNQFSRVKRNIRKKDHQRGHRNNKQNRHDINDTK